MAVTSWLVVTLASAAVGLVACPVLTAIGLRQLAEQTRRQRTNFAAAAASGAVAATTAVAAARHAGSGWWLPAMLAWALTLTAAAVCDARTQRVPTRLLRIGTSVAAILVVTACAATKDWRALALTLVACMAAGLILGLCWRFAGAGFGDVRLALAGGLGLGHTTHRGLLIAVAIFVVLTASQAAWALARTGDRRTTFALGPALAIGFLVAAAT